MNSSLESNLELCTDAISTAHENWIVVTSRFKIEDTSKAAYLCVGT